MVSRKHGGELREARVFQSFLRIAKFDSFKVSLSQVFPGAAIQTLKYYPNVSPLKVWISFHLATRSGRQTALLSLADATGATRDVILL